jgi:hypothetical protein
MRDNNNYITAQKNVFGTIVSSSNLSSCHALILFWAASLRARTNALADFYSKHAKPHCTLPPTLISRLKWFKGYPAGGGTTHFHKTKQKYKKK